AGDPQFFPVYVDSIDTGELTVTEPGGGAPPVPRFTVYATNGITVVGHRDLVSPALTLPQSVIKYKDAANASQELAASDTLFDGTYLKPTTEIPRRALRNSAGTGYEFVAVEDLVNDTVPTAPDATVKTTDGLTTVTTIAGNVAGNLPGSRIKYKDESDADAETSSANTDYDNGSNTLRPATQIPRRELKNRNGTGMGVYATAGRLIADTVPNAPIPLKFAWAAGDADTYTWTVTDDEAGSYTTYTNDGGSGTITYNKNGAGFAALSGTIVLAVNDTIVIRRTTSTSNGWSKWA
ncbi:MAG TPA: hypothetical protein PKY96_18470, partial [Flavobacteriales bacterium]|nr:hypothetical protein [Flavobacteriales bacterium]